MAKLDQQVDSLDGLTVAIAKIDEGWNGKTQNGSYVSEHGDCLVCFNESVPYYRERVDGLLTVYRATEGGRIIGVQVKDVSSLDASKVLVAVQSRDDKPERDIVMILLLTLQRIDSAPELRAARTQIYADAINSLRGCGTSSGELVGA